MIGFVVAAATTAKVVSDMKKSDELNESAQKKRIRAMRTLADAENDRAYEEERMEKSVLRLATRKKGVLTTSISRFIDVYGKIKKIRFLESDGIRELVAFSPRCCNEMKDQIIIIQQKEITPSSALTKNVVVSSLFFGLAGAITASIVDDAKNRLDAASDKLKQARVYAEQQRICGLSYHSIAERADHMTDILTKLNMLFVKSLNNTEPLVEAKGDDRSYYKQDDIAQIGTCLNLAMAVKDILDAPILDRDGELAKETLAVIERGNQCVIEMQESIFAI